MLTQDLTKRVNKCFIDNLSTCTLCKMPYCCQAPVGSSCHSNGKPRRWNCTAD